MAEMLSMEQADARYGKKGVATGGLVTGIIGSALGVLNGAGGVGNILGGNNANSGLCAVPSIWEICEKQNAENVALTAAIYQGRIQTMTDLAGVFERLNTRLVEVEKKDAALEASLPLAMQLAAVNAERYADNKVSDLASKQCQMDFFLQREIDKKINGTMGLPWSDLITGIPRMPNCTVDVTCPGKPA